MKENEQITLRKEKLDNDKRFTLRCIIAGFPGVGKSTAAQRYPHIFIDLESSNYHWCTKDGVKVCNPEWPINYVNDIIKEADKIETSPYDTISYILISTHYEVLQELAKRNVVFHAILPKSKDIYIRRYRDRGSDESFIKLLDSKFEDFVKDVEASDALTIWHTDGYVSDILS